MNYKKIFPLSVAVLITIVLFYKFFLFGLVPFPGDLLISEYNPWKSYSYLGYNPGSYPNKAQYFDVIRQLYPWKTLVVQELLKGSIPFWNPYNFSGSPLLANSQSSVLYPLNIMYAFLPQIIGWSMIIVIQPFLSFIFTYLFVRKLQLSVLSSIMSALAFSCCLFMSVFLEYGNFGNTILWLPLILFSLELLSKEINLKHASLLLLGVVASATAGHLQLFILVILFSLTYAVFKLYKTSLYQKGVIALLFICSVGVTSFQLLPTFELIQLSSRINQFYSFLINTLLIQPHQLVVFFSPDIFGNPATKNYLIHDTYPGNALYIGLIPFVISFLALFHFKKNSYVRFFSIASLVIFIFLFRTPFTEIFYTLNIPLFSTSSPNNGMFMLSFSLSILAGFGLEYWVSLKKEKKVYIVVGLIYGLFIVQFGYLFIFHKNIISIKNVLYSFGISGVLLILLLTGSIFKRKNAIGVLLVVITFFDLFYFLQKFNSFVPISTVFPKADIMSYLAKDTSYSRHWGYGAANIQANFSTQYHLFSPEGYDPLYPRTYGEFIQSSKDGKVSTTFDTQSRSDAVIFPGNGKDDLSSNKYRKRILDLLSVKYILDRVENGSSEKTFPSEEYSLTYNKDGWKVFENKDVLPRVSLYDHYMVANSPQKVGEILFNDEFNPKETVILDKEVVTKPEKGEGSARISTYSPEKITIKTTSSSNQLLLLTDTYYPGWKAMVDSKEVSIYKANYTFRVIEVPKGEHTVEFMYYPQSFSLGMKTSIMSVVLFLGIIATKRYVKKK